jgi:holo-[acyl-carrier protein] synthase
MGVVNLRSGAPTLALTGGAAKRLAAITPAGLIPRIHLSLTDDHPYAQAFVVIEGLLPHEHELTGEKLAGPVSSV